MRTKTMNMFQQFLKSIYLVASQLIRLHKFWGLPGVNWFVFHTLVLLQLGTVSATRAALRPSCSYLREITKTVSKSYWLGGHSTGYIFTSC